MALIQFTRNYRDLSTDAGFQFEFHCDRCGNGYQTEFQASTLGTVTSALDAASNLFGGVFGSAANAARNVRSAGWEKAHDNAFAGSVEEAKPHFHKCKRCGNGWTVIAGMMNVTSVKIARPTFKRNTRPFKCKPRSTMRAKKLKRWITSLLTNSNKLSLHPVHIVGPK